MEQQLKTMGKRLKELRTILEIPVSEMAQVTKLSEEDYLKHEEGLVDSSFTFIYRCTKRLGVDLATLVTGEAARLSFYDLTPANEGMPVKRRENFEYLHLASHLKERHVEPMRVFAPPQDENSPIPLATHAGQEFDYILKGTLKLQLDDKVEIMKPGDNILYDSSHPHGMIAIGNEPCEFLAVVIHAEGCEHEILSHKEGSSEKPAEKQRFYHRFMDETLDENGTLKSVKFHYPDNFNFAYDVVDEIAKMDPNRLALLHIDRNHVERRFTFTDIARLSCKAANYLVSLGIRKGDHVMLVLERSYHFWIMINAIHRIGAVAVPAMNQLQTKDFVYRLTKGNIKCAVYTSCGDVAFYMNEACRQIDQKVIRIVAGAPKYEEERNFDEEIDRYSDTFERPADLKATDPSIMFFSSGTTGYPKMVEHCFTYPLGHIITARWWHNVVPGGLHLTISDTGWAKALWGKIYGQWMADTAVFVYDFARFDPADILPMFKKYNVTTFCAPPTMYRFFIREDLSKYDLSSIRYATTAGEALNAEVLNIFRQNTGLTIREGFGQTETTLMIGTLIGMEPKPGSMGKPVPHYPVVLVDPDDNPVKMGEVGQICVRTEKFKVPGLFFGYYNDPEKTDEAWANGLYHTGDTAWRDEDGYYWYVGRCDDLIKSSGYRIGPFEVESVMMELPYVLECAVVGAPDPIRGQIVKAYIVLTKNTKPSDELKKEIQDYVKHHTAPYKYPRQIEFIEAMPKTTSGKIRRADLRKM